MTGYVDDLWLVIKPGRLAAAFEISPVRPHVMPKTAFLIAILSNSDPVALQELDRNGAGLKLRRMKDGGVVLDCGFALGRALVGGRTHWRFVFVSQIKTDSQFVMTQRKDSDFVATIAISSIGFSCSDDS